MNPMDMLPAATTAAAPTGAGSASRGKECEGEGGFLAVLTDLVARVAEQEATPATTDEAADGEAEGHLRALGEALADGEEEVPVAEQAVVDAARWLLHAALHADASGGSEGESVEAELEAAVEAVDRVVAGERLLVDGGEDAAPAVPDGEAEGQDGEEGSAEIADGATVTGAEGRPTATDGERAAVKGEPATTRPVAAGSGAETGSASAESDAGDADAAIEGEADPAVADEPEPSAGQLPAHLAAARADSAASSQSEAGPETATPQRATHHAGAETSEVAGTTPTAQPSAPTGEVRGASALRPGLATTIERIAEATTRLENQPPPRQLVLELGDMRVRLSLDEAGLRLQLLDENQLSQRDLLRAASEELRARGFDLADDGPGEHAGGDPEQAQARAGSEHARPAGDGRGRTLGPTAGDSSLGTPRDTAIRL